MESDVAAAEVGADAGAGASSSTLGTGWNVAVPRSFFTTPVEEILAACEGNDQLTAFEAIGQAQSSAQ
jgi:hypothetical protein